MLVQSPREDGQRPSNEYATLGYERFKALRDVTIDFTRLTLLGEFGVGELWYLLGEEGLDRGKRP